MDQTTAADLHRLERARDAIKRGEPLAAIVQLRAHLSVSDDSAEAEEVLGIAQWQAGNKDRAFEAFNRATSLDPGRASAHFNYAICLDGAGRLDDAIEEVQTALYIKPDYGAAKSLEQRLRRKLQDRIGHSDANFAVVDKGDDPLLQSSGEWARLKCVSCGSMNFITARSCARCGSYLPEVEDVIPVE
jgi:tetratricopeptide (TPR) repeat protein